MFDIVEYHPTRRVVKGNLTLDEVVAFSDSLPLSESERELKDRRPDLFSEDLMRKVLPGLKGKDAFGLHGGFEVRRASQT